ncbi:hypothetical protein O181_000957 [Austropuccinia psidii MF-1]|uniref:Reverse transcriptase domain-containing protein n=1 Tax=Austropuccinia psidii MF-1 TaxID=1389203 RepID=A0A9Q3B9N1_9BASI|nr:hypothetical protein [Austropuccinia psidii MF-1]
MDSNESPALFITHNTKWVADLPSLPSFEWDFFIIDEPKGEDLILFYDFLYHFNPIIHWKNGLITYESSHKDSSSINSSTSNDLATASLLLLRDEVFKDIKNVGDNSAICSLHLFQGDMDLPPLSFHASLEEQWDEEEEPEEIETVLKVVPPAYLKYLDLLSKVKAEKLPPHQACDNHIELEGLLPPLGVIHSISNEDSETLWAYISENVEKGSIGPSSSSTGAPVLFVNKKDGGLRLCVYYRKLNSVTRKNRYPAPPMNQLLTMLNGSTIFSRIDMHGAYNLLRIEEGEEHLTAFRTKYGSYEYFVMPFDLTNAPASFQNIVNDIFADFLKIFVVVYLDDVIVFSSSEEEHVKQVATVLQRLRDNDLFFKASKCVFHASSVEPWAILFQVMASRWILQKFTKSSIGHIPRTSKLFNPFLALPISIVVSLRIILQNYFSHFPPQKRLSFYLP